VSVVLASTISTIAIVAGIVAVGVVVPGSPMVTPTSAAETEVPSDGALTEPLDPETASTATDSVAAEESTRLRAAAGNEHRIQRNASGRKSLGSACAASDTWTSRVDIPPACVAYGCEAAATADVRRPGATFCASFTHGARAWGSAGGAGDAALEKTSTHDGYRHQSTADG